MHTGPKVTQTEKIQRKQNLGGRGDPQNISLLSPSPKASLWKWAGVWNSGALCVTGHAEPSVVILIRPWPPCSVAQLQVSGMAQPIPSGSKKTGGPEKTERQGTE